MNYTTQHARDEPLTTGRKGENYRTFGRELREVGGQKYMKEKVEDHRVAMLGLSEQHVLMTVFEL